MTRLLLLATVLLAACGHDQAPGESSSLALLAQEADGFAQAEPGVPLRFPEDHGAHPDFRLEWWYVTANLTDAAGRQHGVQWTLFRSARPAAADDSANPWHDRQLYMAHVAVTTPTDHHAAQRYARGGQHGGWQQAGVRSAPFAAWLDDWTLTATGEGIANLQLKAAAETFAMDLQLGTERPLVLHGVNGFSQKHAAGGGSYYYSQPFYQVSGRVTVEGVDIDVEGQAWLDREWSSQFLKADQQGWDWFALHLDDGRKLMLYQLRPVGDAPPYRYAVSIGADGAAEVLPTADLAMTPQRWVAVAGRQLPMAWRISRPDAADLLVSALHPQQWMNLDFPYWEGVVLVTDSEGSPRGRGYMELTGY